MTVEKETNSSSIVIIDIVMEQRMFVLDVYIFVFNVCTEPQSSSISPGKRKANTMYVS